MDSHQTEDLQENGRLISAIMLQNNEKDDE